MSIGKSSLFFIVGSFTAKPPGRQRGAPRTLFHVHWVADWLTIELGYGLSGPGVMPMRRREFVGLLGGAAAAIIRPRVSRAQSSGKVFRIGFLGLPSADSLPK